MLTVDLSSVYLLSCVDTVIRYIEVDFMFGLPDYVRYIEEFVISRFVISRFYSIHFTVTLAGHRISFVISRTSLNRGSLNRGSTVVRLLESTIQLVLHPRFLSEPRYRFVGLQEKEMLSLNGISFEGCLIPHDAVDLPVLCAHTQDGSCQMEGTTYDLLQGNQE